MSQPPLESTTFCTNTTNQTTSPIDLIPVKTKTTDPIPLTQPNNPPTKPTDSLLKKENRTYQWRTSHDGKTKRVSTYPICDDNRDTFIRTLHNVLLAPDI